MKECDCCWSKNIYVECESAEEMIKLSDLIGDDFMIRYLCKNDFDYTNRELKEKGYKERLIENNGKWSVK